MSSFSILLHFYAGGVRLQGHWVNYEFCMCNFISCMYLRVSFMNTMTFPRQPCLVELFLQGTLKPSLACRIGPSCAERFVAPARLVLSSFMTSQRVFYIAVHGGAGQHGRASEAQVKAAMKRCAIFMIESGLKRTPASKCVHRGDPNGIRTSKHKRFIYRRASDHYPRRRRLSERR